MSEADEKALEFANGIIAKVAQAHELKEKAEADAEKKSAPAKKPATKAKTEAKDEGKDE